MSAPSLVMAMPGGLGVMQRQLHEAEERARVLEAHINSLPQHRQPPPGYLQQPMPGHYAPPQQQLPPAPKPAEEKKEGCKIPGWVLQWTSMLVCTAIYFVVGAFVYLEFEPDWTPTQAVYFLMVTMSTVGYGDMSPTSDGAKVFTVIWIFTGLLAVFSQLGACIGSLVTPITRGGRNILDKCFPKNMIDIDGDGEADFAYPRHFIIYYAKGLFPSILLNVGLQMGSAAVFHAIEGWGYGDAVYHCFVTATTVGYGDISIATEEGRIWATFHILFSVVLLAEMLASVGELGEERRIALERLGQLQRQLDANMLSGLLANAAAMRAGDKEYDANQLPPAEDLNETEFVICMLLQMGITKIERVRPLIKKFRSLDKDGSGRLGQDDLQLALSQPTGADAAAGVRGSKGSAKTMPYDMAPPGAAMYGYPYAGAGQQPHPAYQQPVYQQPPYQHQQPSHVPQSTYYQPQQQQVMSPSQVVPAPNVPASIAAAFMAADVDKDGKLDPAEFARAIQAMQGPPQGVGAPPAQEQWGAAAPPPASPPYARQMPVGSIQLPPLRPPPGFQQPGVNYDLAAPVRRGPFAPPPPYKSH